MSDRRRLNLLLLIFIALISCIFIYQFLLKFQPIALISPNAAYLPHNGFHNYTHALDLLGRHDYNLLVNYTFTFDLMRFSCNDSTLLLVLVHSAPGNHKKRDVVRTTWGQKNDWARVLFVMGRSDNDTIQQQVIEENEIYNDIIQGSFLDTYRNLTYKHIMCLKYVVYHCPQAKYILKSDDDVFVNMPLLKIFLTVDLSPFGVSNALLCPVKRFAVPLRTYRSKWRVSFEEYPQRTYPTYCLGWAILYSPDVVFALYRSAQNSGYVFWIDDVYITGTMAVKMNVLHTDITDLVLSKNDQKDLVDDGVFPSKPFLLGQPDLDARQVRILWNKVKARQVPKSVWKFSVHTIR